MSTLMTLLSAGLLYGCLLILFYSLYKTTDVTDYKQTQTDYKHARTVRIRLFGYTTPWYMSSVSFNRHALRPHSRITPANCRRCRRRRRQSAVHWCRRRHPSSSAGAVPARSPGSSPGTSFHPVVAPPGARQGQQKHLAALRTVLSLTNCCWRGRCKTTAHACFAYEEREDRDDHEEQEQNEDRPACAIEHRTKEP